MNLSIENIVDTENCYLADVILSPAKSNAEKPKSIVAKASQPKKVAVLGEIDNKLKAAENRRKSLVQEKLEKIAPLTSKIQQKKNKVQQHQLNKLSNTSQQIENKIKKHEENYAKIMQEKVELAKKMSGKKNFQSPDHQKNADAKMAEIENKLVEAEKRRTSLVQEKLELVKNRENRYLKHKEENIANSKACEKNEL